MAPKTKTKKTSYVIFNKVINLTHWDGAIRIIESPPLTFKPQNHLLEGARAGLVSFSNFFHFQVFLWSSVLIRFGLVNAWVLLWDGSRWNPDFLGGVGTCLGWFWFIACLKLSNEPFYLCSCVRIHVHMCVGGFMRTHPLFMRTHLCSLVHYGCMLQHAYARRTLRMHTRDLRTHIGTHKPHFLSNLIFFTHFSYPIMILMLFFILFCRSYHLSWVRVVLAVFLHGIGP